MIFPHEFHQARALDEGGNSLFTENPPQMVPVGFKNLPIILS